MTASLERSQKQGFHIPENRELMSSGNGERGRGQRVNSKARQISGDLFETWLHHFLESVSGQGT